MSKFKKKYSLGIPNLTRHKTNNLRLMSNSEVDSWEAFSVVDHPSKDDSKLKIAGPDIIRPPLTLRQKLQEKIKRKLEEQKKIKTTQEKIVEEFVEDLIMVYLKLLLRDEKRNRVRVIFYNMLGDDWEKQKKVIEKLSEEYGFEWGEWIEYSMGTDYLEFYISI